MDISCPIMNVHQKSSETDRRRKVFSGGVITLPHIHIYVIKYCYTRRGVVSGGDCVRGGLCPGGLGPGVITSGVFSVYLLCTRHWLSIIVNKLLIELTQFS